MFIIKFFSYFDFFFFQIGDMCKALASRIRGACAAVSVLFYVFHCKLAVYLFYFFFIFPREIQSSFDDFHRYSAKIIRTAVFGVDETTKHVNNKLRFEANSLVVTSVDIQSVEPVDQRTRESLQKSVQLAIEITTASQEATARHEAERVEQEARGRLERQKIDDQSKAEASRKELLQLQVESAAVETVGQARAEAKARADAIQIEGEAAVSQAELRSKAARIEAETELERLVRAREAELGYIKMQNELEVAKSKELADIESKKFTSVVRIPWILVFVLLFLLFLACVFFGGSFGTYSSSFILLANQKRCRCPPWVPRTSSACSLRPRSSRSVCSRVLACSLSCSRTQSRPSTCSRVRL
jgi:major vault protein